MINIKLEIAKRAAEIIQEKGQAINYLNINAALNKADIELKKERGKYDLKKVIRGFIS